MLRFWGEFTKGKKPGERLMKSFYGVNYAFRWCPPGTLPMDSDRFQAGANPSQALPVQQTQGFWILETEVTQQMWKMVIDSTLPTIWNRKPNQPQILGDNLPALELSLKDASAFCKTMTRRTGMRIALPTGAQWEYACRAGTRGNIPEKALTAFAWIQVNSGGRPQPVGTRKPNPWGLYDILGNAEEITGEEYFETEQSVDSAISLLSNANTTFISGRGGSFNYSSINRVPRNLISQKESILGRAYDAGFRIIMTGLADRFEPGDPAWSIPKQKDSKGKNKPSGNKPSSNSADNSAESGKNVSEPDSEDNSIDRASRTSVQVKPVRPTAKPSDNVRPQTQVPKTQRSRGTESVSRNESERLPTPSKSEPGRGGKKILGVISVDSRGEILYWNLDTGKASRTVTTPDRMLRRVAISPDGRKIATAGTDGIVRIWKVGGAVPVLELPKQPKQVNDVSFSPDGTKLVTACLDGAVNIWETESGKKLISYAMKNDAWVSQWLTPGKRIVCGLKNGEVHVLLTDKQWTDYYCKIPGSVEWIACSPDGTRALAVTSAGNISVLPVPPFSKELKVKQVFSRYASAVWAPDGQTFYCVGHSPQLAKFSLESPLEPTMLDLGSKCNSIAISSDGKKRICSSDGCLKLIDLETKNVTTLKSDRKFWDVRFLER